ncbi:MAG: hypothetical protein EOP06_12415 [Proteobacteria bacterium]|nr:MAG: hypothetical protein EOP06_12415 [Pseudomonadota bacterium]
MSRVFTRIALVALAAITLTALCNLSAKAQTIGSEFATSYSVVDLGTPSGVAGPFGGLTLKNGDSNTLLLGGSANSAAGNVNQVSVVRNVIDGQNRITGFTGTASQLSTAANIDGGLLYAPNGALLYTGYSNNTLGQIKPGSSTPDKIINLSSLGIAASTGTIQIIPAGFGVNSGKLLIASYNSSDYYTADLVADGNGTYDLANVSASLVNLGGGPEGIVYVPGGSPLFANPSVLISEYASGRVSAYEVNALGIPIATSRRDFITGLNGAEGATIDASTGDFLFSTFGGSNRVISVRGLAPSAVVPEANTAALLGLALPMIGAVAVVRRRKK